MLAQIVLILASNFGCHKNTNKGEEVRGRQGFSKSRPEVNRSGNVVVPDNGEFSPEVSSINKNGLSIDQILTILKEIAPEIADGDAAILRNFEKLVRYGDSIDRQIVIAIVLVGQLTDPVVALKMVKLFNDQMSINSLVSEIISRSSDPSDQRILDYLNQVTNDTDRMSYASQLLSKFDLSEKSVQAQIALIERIGWDEHDASILIGQIAGRLERGYLKGEISDPSILKDIAKMLGSDQAAELFLRVAKNSLASADPVNIRKQSEFWGVDEKMLASEYSATEHYSKMVSNGEIVMNEVPKLMSMIPDDDAEFEGYVYRLLKPYVGLETNESIARSVVDFPSEARVPAILSIGREYGQSMDQDAIDKLAKMLRDDDRKIFLYNVEIGKQLRR